LPCPVGYYCQAGTVDYLSTPCPVGMYCLQGVSRGTACPAGTFRGEVGGASASDCTNCPAGYYCPQQSVKPIICPSGYYCPGNTMNVCNDPQSLSSCDTNPPNPCPQGTHAGGLIGLKDTSQCLGCPSGKYCPAGSVLPTFCPEGTYNPSPNITSVGGCRKCTAGMSCSVAGLIYPNGDCQPGNISFFANLACDICIHIYRF
jgi:hypothetical protein